MTNGDVTAT